VFNNATSMDDPVLQQDAREFSKTNAGGNGRLVLATDELLSHIMASPRSIYRWDLVVTRFDSGIMFIDKRDDSGIEMLTVNETYNQGRFRDEKDEKEVVAPFDVPEKMAIEATAINQNYSQQVIDKEKPQKKFEHPNPLFDPEDEEEGSEPAAFAYRYREWNLNSTTKLIARTEIHNYTKELKPNGKKKTAYQNSYALNETNPRLTKSFAWRQKVDVSRGTVFGDALKNNACKIGKWSAQALLSGVDNVKIGFVTRKSVKDPLVHEIVATQSYQPERLAEQINLQQSNCWAIVKHLIDMIYNEPPGKYVIMRDPNKPMVLVYEVPMDS
jgi:translation initiation factor 3 subunit D